ncbi:MAG TPA: DJ-1/PfpI family protein [Thermoanaerobaculia bacterium]|jgi:putative intracellular protease/amidase|nr:DJ-1/PfpI family protein [Thermoanaerobaculia bacterium]
MRSAIRIGVSLLLLVMLTGAALAAQPPAKPAPRNLAILLFEGVQIIDYTGPYEVFGHAVTPDGPAFNIYTVAEKPGPITTAMGMSVNPRYTFADAPKPDVLVLPGGDVNAHFENPAVMQWIKDSSKDAEVVLSVCNGAFFLAKAGLLDGLEATTFAGLIDELRTTAPKARVVTDRRFVDNGKIVTSAGLSSGIEGSLHVIEKLLGKGYAQRVALGLEYNWQPDGNWARAALPDRLVQVNTNDGFRVEPLVTQGAVDRWEKQWAVTTDQKPADYLASVNRALETGNKWTREANGWTFKDPEGKAWNGTAVVEPLSPGKLKLTMKIARRS